MNLLGAIRLPLTLNNRTELVSCFIGKGMDDLVILGTNALELFGMKLGPLKSAEVLCATKPVEVVMKERVFIPPHSAKVVTVASAVQPGEYVMLSKDPGIAPGVCTVTAEGTANVNMVNSSNEARVVRKGDVIGHWASGEWLPSNVSEVGADMLEHGPKDVQIDETARATELIDVLRTNTSMTPELEETIMQFRDVFAVRDSELTQTSLIEHDIDTGDSAAIKQKTRPVPIGARQEFKAIIQDLLERGIITRSYSNWASPVVLVRKKDGSLRLCVDYRALNKVTKQDVYPLPAIDAVIQSLEGKKVFSTLDLASGYWQIRLSEAAKEKSAFTTSEGLFQFEVLPFGLSTSPAQFQRLMDMVLGELGVKDSEVFVYIDDVLIATTTKERHMEVLRMVLQAFRHANLKFKPQKCAFFRDKVNFLGHVIDENGVRTDPDKVDKIRGYPVPQNMAELRAFLGLASYYRKFILGFSKIAKPLYDLTSPKTEWQWTAMQDKAFERLKQVMTEAPVLARLTLLLHRTDRDRSSYTPMRQEMGLVQSFARKDSINYYTQYTSHRKVSQKRREITM